MSELQTANGGGPGGLAVLLTLGVLVGLAMAAVVLISPARSAGLAAPTPVPDLIAPGKPALDFSAFTPQGDSVRLSDLRGHPVALNFWATWCGPCEVEMPELERAQARYTSVGLVILAVNAGERAADVQAYMQELGLTFPAVLDPDGAIGSLYEVRVFPTTIWIDSEGIIRAEHLGPLTAEQIDRYMSDVAGPSPAGE
jgi:thiol-disulfide isomerase/thioredoxin